MKSNWLAPANKILLPDRAIPRAARLAFFLFS